MILRLVAGGRRWRGRMRMMGEIGQMRRSAACCSKLRSEDFLAMVHKVLGIALKTSGSSVCYHG